MAKNESPYPWTVMVYLAGDNNLTEESVFSLTELSKAKMDDRIAVIAQLDPKSSNIPSHRYVIRGSGPGLRGKSASLGARVAADAVAIEAPRVRFPPRVRRGAPARRARAGIGETDTGDPATLFDFISWSQEHYPADHYLLVLAGHGAGTEEDFLLKDENPTSSLSMRQLKSVFAEVSKRLKKIDVLGMDVCLMSMVEVCHQLKGHVKYLVGSESFSPTAGWPYGEILSQFEKELQAGNKVSPERLASLIMREYIRFYGDYVVGGLSVDQSVLKVSAAQDVVKAVKKLATAMEGELTKESFRDAVVLAHWEAQSYNGELFVDLRDFCDLLTKRYPRLKTACGLVIGALGKLVRESCFTGVENQFSYGASIYFPWAEVAPSYRDLAFARAAHWDHFLQAYVENTRRKPRGFRKGRKELLDFSRPRPFKFASVVPGLEGFRKAGERKAGERGVNPVHSMRNPPITVVREGLSECVQKDPAAVSALETFSHIADSAGAGES